GTGGLSNNYGLASSPAAPAAGAPSQQMEQTLSAQLVEWQRRAQSLDANNKELHSQIAQSQLYLKTATEREAALQKQLSDVATQLASLRAAKGDADKRLETLQASTTRKGGAVITANSSLQQQLAVIDVPGVEVRPEGDVIRIEIPADQLFVQSTAQLHQNAF